jgi:hypothetical protein
MYRVSTLNKKSVTEVSIWIKDDKVIKQSIGWRWGAVFMEEEPDLSDYNEESSSIDVYALGAELDSCDDGCWEDWEYDESLSPEEVEEIESAYEENFIEGLEDLGWSMEDTELWFSGPLEVVKVENDNQD